MATVSVCFSISWEDDEDLSGFIANKEETLLGDWADCSSNGESAANDICANLFDHNLWDDCFGGDATSERVQVEIHSPPSIAGLYEVDLERVVKASATLRRKSKEAA
jgi:hypothetical protein